jgi:hypothetical protein
VLALVLTPVVEAPQLRALVLGIPLAEAVAVGEEALLGARLFLVPARAADGCIRLEFGQGVEQRHRLQAVAAGGRAFFLHHPSLVDGILDEAHDQLSADLLDQPISKIERFREVVAGVDVHQREGDASRVEGATRQVHQQDRIFAAGKEQHRALALRRHFAQHEDRLGFQLFQVRS